MRLCSNSSTVKKLIFDFTTILTGIAAGLFVVNTTACKTPYDPPAITSPISYLVVEGLINSGGDSTIIKITRTINIGESNRDFVTKAIVTVEDNENGSSALIEKNKGVYIAPKLVIEKTKQYRLRIKTVDNQVYLSDFVAVLTTPAIDSVGFNIDTLTTGLRVYVNTHDATNSVKYYRWEYTEGWEYHSFYLSTAQDIDSVVVPRIKDIYFCYNVNKSSDIPLASTADLSKSVIFQKQINFIPSISEKLELRYGIVVKQYGLSADAYNFYSKIEKNSSQLGGIFDVQPSEIPGNIHCITNPSQPVIGYIVVSNVTTKTAFISNYMLPRTWVATYPAFCLISPPAPTNPPLPILYMEENPKLFEFIDDSLNHSTPICVDCTVRGNSKPPSFWVY